MLAQSRVPGAAISMSDVKDRAKALKASLAPQADEVETLRRMPPGFVEKMVDSGLMPLLRPARYGGYEGDWEMFAEAVGPLAQVSGSMAWCAGFLLHHQWVLSHFAIDVQDQVYSENPNPPIATSFAPTGKVERVPGGYKVTGEWSFGSGIDHSKWAITGALAPQPDGPPAFKWMMFKPGQFRVRDTWYSTGLRGSGSNNIVVEDAFVEEAWTVDMAEAQVGRHPGRNISSHPLFTAGSGVQFQFGLVLPAIVIGEGLFTSFLDFFRDKTGAFLGGKKADSPNIQLRVGEAAAELAAAKSIIYRLNSRVMAGEMQGSEAVTEFTRDVGLATRMTKEAADRLFTLSGARGLNEGNLFGRHWRDVHAISNHAGLQWDGFFTSWGAAALNGGLGGGGH